METQRCYFGTNYPMLGYAGDTEHDLCWHLEVIIKSSLSLYKLTVIGLQSDRAQDKNTDRNIRNTYREVFIEESL